ncbi:uncharacterized protein LOC144706677 [Wolffia australiana]
MEGSQGSVLNDFRFDYGGEQRRCDRDYSKKRKFQQESSTVPPSKQKTHDRSCGISGFSHGSSSVITLAEFEATSAESVTDEHLQISRFASTTTPEAGEDEEIDDFIEEIFPSATIEELSSSDLAVYPSSLWDVHLGSRKPTIDEEFEEFFSGLIL